MVELEACEAGDGRQSRLVRGGAKQREESP